MRVLAEKAPWKNDGACLGLDPDIFFPRQGASAEPAKAICADCPVVQECLEFALRNREIHGVWGGVSERARRKLRRQRIAEGTLEPDPPPKINHGTTTGYHQHYAQGVPYCDDCRRANAAYRLDRNRRGAA